MGKKQFKLFSLSPFASPRVKCITLSATTLRELMILGRKTKTGRPERNYGPDDATSFLECLPGLEDHEVTRRVRTQVRGWAACRGCDATRVTTLQVHANE